MKAGLRHAVKRNWQDLESEVLRAWPLLQPGDVTAAGRDPSRLVQTIGERTGHSAYDVERRLAGVVERIQRQH